MNPVVFHPNMIKGDYMKTIILTILFTMLFVPTISANPKNIDELGIKGIDLVFDMQFEQANKIFDEMIRMDPENAIGYFLKSKSYLWMYLFSTNDKEHIERSLELFLKTIDIAKEMLNKNEDDIDALFYVGNAYGYIGRRCGETGSWIKAFWYGRKGANYLKKVIKKDHDYYDAYYGLGMYHYYTSVLPKFIKVLSFLLGGLEGDREKGIDEVILASSKGNLTRSEAKLLVAAEIYLNYEKNYEAALPLLKELTTEYPHNHFYKFNLADCYRNLYKYDLSFQTIEKALQSESLNEYPYLRSQIYYLLGRTYSEMNEFDKAISAYQSAYKISQSEKGNKSWVYSWSQFSIGLCYEMMGSIDKAHEYYSQIKKEDNEGAYKYAQAMIKNPLTPAKINLTKGKNYLKCEKYTQAYTIFNDLIESELNENPLNTTFIAEVYHNLGKVEYELKEYQKSIQTYRKVFALNDIKEDWIKPWSHYYLANCYRDIGEAEKAKHEYDIAYEYDDNKIRSDIDKARSGLE
jgi:tetratricopeptide (TPR) repeat protein